MTNLLVKLLLSLLFFLVSTAHVSAIPPDDIKQPELPKTAVEEEFSAEGLPAQIITEILPIIIGIGGFLTVIVIVVSGIQFITSGGDPKAAAGARARLIYALIGFIIILLSFAILQAVNFLFLKTKVV